MSDRPSPARRPTARARAVHVAALLVGIVVLLGGCGDGAQTAARPSTREPTAGPAPSAGRRTALTPGAGLLLGVPVYDGDFADPYVLRVGKRNFAYATNTADAEVPLIESGDGPLGTYRGDVLAQLPPWSAPGRVWAPAVARFGDRYVLYFSTRVTASGRQCISRAVASDPRGPFVDDSTGPMVCQEALGGTIDPSVVSDRSGRSWLLFKNDGNCCDVPTSLWSQRLAPDGLSVVGPTQRLLTARDDTWEGGLVEGPSMVRGGGRYWLFYSGNAWDSDRYAIGVASCASPAGPCRRRSVDAPWMGSTTFASGPGGQEFFDAGGQVWMVYHGWARGRAGAAGAERRLYLDIVEVGADGPRRVGGRRALGVVALAGAAVAAVVAGTVVLVHRRRSRQRPTTPPT